MTLKRVGWATTLALVGAIGACTVKVNDDDNDGSGGSAGAAGSDASGGKTSSGGTSGDAGAGNSTGDAGETGDGGSGTGGDTSSAGEDGAAGDDGAAGAPSTGGDNALPEGFTPSTLPSDFELEVTDDLILNGEMCGSRAEIDTDDGVIRCYTPGTTTTKTYYAFAVVKQEDDGSEAAVFAGQNIEVDTTIQVEVVGQRPLVLLAPGDVTVRGYIEAVPNGKVAHGGGFSAPGDRGEKGLGPGGGGGGGETAAGGGGGYCGPGGKGGGDEGAVGGKSYGTPEIVPLIGGSSGGRGFADSGAGGGAIQIVAGGELYITSTGTIHVGGGGGGWGSAGGGSGGAILLEGETVRVAGTLAANGGGGGGQGSGGDNGENATPDADPAKGGPSAGANAETGIGGIGAAGDTVEGGDGGSTGGGGGGGAGRIRINSRSGEATITGTVSPSLETECATEGTLAD